MRYMNNLPAGGGSRCGCTQRVPSAGCARPYADQPVCAQLPVMAFVEPQVWDCTYTCGQALSRGTLFPALDKPFMGKGGCCNG